MTSNPAAWAVTEAMRLEPIKPSRFAHTKKVATTAQLLSGLLPDQEVRDMLIAAACVHDIGYLPDLAHTGCSIPSTVPATSPTTATAASPRPSPTTPEPATKPASAASTATSPPSPGRPAQWRRSSPTATSPPPDPTDNP